MLCRLPKTCVRNSHTSRFVPKAMSLSDDMKVVSFGGAGIDYLASVGDYPLPDEKLRTEKLEVQGGGNSANQATASARLGLRPWLVSKVGGDGLGQAICDELAADGVNTELVLRAAGHPSPFTYIIVDKKGGTRTCIHTPGAPMLEAECSADLMDRALADARLVWFDGRLTEAALVLAREARRRKIPVLVEAERLRPTLDQLLQEADFVVTSEKFPTDWTGEVTVGDAMLAVLARLPRVTLLVTTLGTKGAVLLERCGDADLAGAGAARPLDAVLQELLAQAQAQKASSSVVACTSVAGVDVLQGGAVGGGAVRALRSTTDAATRARAAEVANAAAQRAASLNSDAGRASAYAMTTVAVHQAAGEEGVAVKVYAASAAGIPAGAVVDTTGAGDAFIGSVVYGLCKGLSRTQTLQLAAVVAAAKCTALGARPGLPKREQVVQHLLEPQSPISIQI